MDNNKPAPSPEELREKRLAYFESKLSLPVNSRSTIPEKLSAKERKADKDVTIMKDPDKGKLRTRPTNSHIETNNASNEAINGLDDIEAEFSRQDYRINSPLKQVKLKARKESFQSDSDFLADVTDRIEEIHVVEPLNYPKNEQKLPEIDSKVPSLDLRDSQNLEAVSVFKSVADFEDLGLSTHRPSSPPSTISVLDKRLTAENSILDASDFKSLLGEDKYEEFLRKSVKDINALYHNKTTETSPHLLEGASTIGPSTISPFTETEVSTEVTENHIVHNKFDTNHSKPMSNNRRHFPDDLSQISSSVHNQIPSKNINDLEQEHHQVQPRNYDQVLVSRNVTFSADEIYRQAYGGRVGPNQNDPRRSQQYSPSSGYYPSSPPYNVMGPQQQQHYPGPMPPPNYQHIPPPNMMYNSHGEMFMSPPSPQNAYFQPYYPRQSPPSRTYMHPGSPGTSPPNAGIFNYPPPNYQQTMFNNMNMNNCNQYRMFVPRPPSQPHVHSPPTQSQNFDNHQGHPHFYPHNHYNKYAKNTNIQKEALSKQKLAGKPMAVPIKEVGKKDRNVKETIKKEDTALRHKEAVRQFHEQRRNQHDDSEEPSNRIKESQNSSYAASSLHRYFSSLENLQQKPEPPRRNSLDDFRESSPESEVDNDNLTTVTGASEVTTAVGTDITSATAMTAGGLTDHIEKLGITVPNLKLGNSKKTDSTSDKKVIICPECSAPNKDYMTWCGDCGEVLIGVQPVLAKKKKARPEKSKKSKNGLSVKAGKDNDVKNHGRNTDVKQTVSQAAKIKPSIKQFKEKAKNKFQEDPKEDDFSDVSSAVTESTISEVKAKFDPKFYRTEKDINEICDVITDPVIRGYIRTYFNQKTKSSLDKDRDDHGMDQDITDAFSEQTEPTTSKDLQDQPNEATPPEEAPENTEFSLDLNLSNTTTDMKQATEASPKPKGRPFGKKKDHVEIDIEVFGIEESREVKSTNSSVSVVPSLNLASSSSSEEEDEAKELNRQMMVDSSIESDVFQAVMEAKKSTNGPVQIQPAKKDSFLAQILGPKTPKHATTRKLSPKQNKKVVQSKVAQSMNSVPYQRRWEKSNLAWSAIQPREMNLKSSVSMPKAKLGFPNKKGVSVYSLDYFGSTENMTMKSTDNSKKQRPASADLYRRKVQQQRPISAQPKPTATAHSRPSSSMRPSSSHARPTSAQLRASTNKKSFTPSPVPLSLDDLENFDDEDDDDVEMLDVGPPLVENDGDDEVNMPNIVEHRLPAELPIKQPVVNLVPETSLSAYNKYHELTPRIQVGDFSPWVCMPDEIWLHIFSYLSHIDLKNCGQVCRQFHRVALDEILWKCIAVKKQHGITDEWLDQIAKRHPISLALIQCHGDLITSDGLKQMFKQCSHTLRELNFSRCSRGSLTGDSLLLHAAETCYNLTHIDASWCHVTDTGLSAIAQSSHRLESVCLNGCQVISDVGLENLIRKHGSSLRVLEMFGCFNINQRGLRFLANNCTNLYTLNLGQCYKLTDSCMTQISANLGRMENLDLRGCKQIRDACIRKIVRNCPRLKSLVLANCPNISDNAMVEVATYSMDIRNIDVCGCRNITDHSIRNITNNCQRLTTLDISSTGCTRSSVNMLANYGNRCLETAKLNFLTDVTDASLIKLVKHCSKLKTLHLYGCSSVRNIHQLIEINRKLDVES